MICNKCDLPYLSMTSGELYCPSCGSTYIPREFLERPKDMPDYNPIPKGGWSKDIRDNLPF